MLWAHTTLHTAHTCPLCRLAVCLQAAKARKQEPISPVSSSHEADVILPTNGRPARGRANTTNPKLPARKESLGLFKVGTPSGSGTAIETAPKPKLRVIRLSAPKPTEPVVMSTKPNDGPTVDSLHNGDVSTKQAPSPPTCDAEVTSPPTCDAVYSAPDGTPTSHSPAEPKHATNEKYRDDEPHAQADRVTSREVAGANRVTGRSVERRGGGGVGLDSASEYLARQRQCAARGRESGRTLPALPLDAEVVKVRLC